MYPASRRCRRLPPPCIRLCLSPPPSHCGRRSPFPRHPSPFPPCSMLFLCSLPSILFLICWLPPFTSVFDALAASFLPQFAPLAGLLPSLFPVLAAPFPSLFDALAAPLPFSLFCTRCLSHSLLYLRSLPPSPSLFPALAAPLSPLFLHSLTSSPSLFPALAAPLPSPFLALAAPTSLLRGGRREE